MLMSDLFKHDQYEANRPRMLSAYIVQMTSYLKSLHPEQPLGEIQAFVNDLVTKQIKVPSVEILRHPTPGNTIRETVSLTHHVAKNIGQDIITPSGTVYMLPTKKKSFLKASLANKIGERKVFKKIYLSALEIGDMIRAKTYNLLQASTKIYVNSAPGAMGSAFNILYDLPGYNAITSTARHSVKYGYAHTERLVDANLFLVSYNDVVAYCIRLMNVQPDAVGDMIEKHGLYIPTVADLTQYFVNSLSYYMMKTPDERIAAFISTFSPTTRAFIFYAGCLKNLVVYNDQFFRAFFQRLFSTEYVCDPNDDPAQITRVFETDLLAMVTSLNYEVLGYNDDGERYNLHDATLHHPDRVRQIMAIARHVESCLQSIGDLLSICFRLDTDIARLGDHSHMVRKAVLVSDTDSVIFSTQTMIEWYSGGKVHFGRSSYEINAFTVYVLSRSLEHVFARLSCGFGMVGDDISKIAMKNEFLYPVMLRTPISKHYVGIVQMQEGKLLPEPKTDIKGIQFRSSTLSSVTNKAAEAFLINAMNTVIKDGCLQAHDLLSTVAGFETQVYNSIMSGDRLFLETTSIKSAEEYADASKSAYFYYEFWESVFVPRFDSMLLPNKCFKLPLIDDGEILKDSGVLDAIKAFDSAVHKRLLVFMEKYPKKSISHILVPPTVTVIPELFRPLIDVRSIIYENTKPFYLGLKSMGFGYTFAKNMLLVTDFFNPNDTVVPHI